MKLGDKFHLTPAAKPGGMKPQAEAPKGGKISEPEDQAVLSGKKTRPASTLVKPTGNPKNQNWTVLAYFAGDNNLEGQMAVNLIELERQGAGKPVNLLAQVDRGNNPTLRLGGKAGMVRYKIEPFKLQPGELDGFSRYNPPTLPLLQKKHRRISSPELKAFGPADAADPKVLEDFLAWGMKEYPAHNYLVYVNSHGSGVAGFITDQGPESRRQAMSLPEFKHALKTAEKAAGVEQDRVVLALDSCLMAQAEAAYEFKDLAGLMLASQSVRYAGGMLPGVLSREEAAGYSPQKMARELFKQDQIPQTFDPALLAAGPGSRKELTVPQETVSLIDLKQMPEVKNQISGLIRALKNSPAPREILKKHLEVRSRTSYSDTNQTGKYASDLPEIARQILKDPEIRDPKLKKAAARLQAALDKAILDSYHKPEKEYDNTSGLGVLTASDPSVYQRAGYSNLNFEKETGWSRFMTSYAPQVKLDPGNLKDPALLSPRLALLAQVSKTLLKHSFAESIAQSRQAISDSKHDASLSPAQRKQKAVFSAVSIPTFIALARANSTEFSPELPVNRADDRLIQKTVNSALGDLVSFACENPRYLTDIVSLKLQIFSALEGEISSKTLSEAARNVLTYEINKQNSKAAEILYTLGKAARNEKIICLKEQYACNDLGFIKAVARLSPEGMELGKSRPRSEKS